jgi:hypothetical protein
MAGHRQVSPPDLMIHLALPAIRLTAARCNVLRVRYAHIINQKLGAPKADVKISIAKWPTANCTYTTPARPKPGRGLVSNILL